MRTIPFLFQLSSVLNGVTTGFVPQYRSNSNRILFKKHTARSVLQQPPSQSPEGFFGDASSAEDVLKGEDTMFPTTGISVNDEMEAAQKDHFVTEIVPLKELPGVAQLLTKPTIRGSYEPARYLLSLSPPQRTSKSNSSNTEENDDVVMEDDATTGSQASKKSFVLIDVPPFSHQLVTRMKSFMGVESKLEAILITSRDSIHYDEAEGVFSVRKSDLGLWKQAYPDLAVVANRLDIPRDCREHVTHVLDGYGPFALDYDSEREGPAAKVRFVETGKPLTYQEWDHNLAEDIMKGRKNADDEIPDEDMAIDDISAESIRSREDGKLVLAAWTPGHTFGSMSYVFPAHGVVCSGHAIPIEEPRAEENFGTGVTGPALDCRGFISTSKAGISKQMKSARHLVETYCDRFDAVLPARGYPLLLEGELDENKQLLLDILDQYRRVGEVYEQLGITGESGEKEQVE